MSEPILTFETYRQAAMKTASMGRPREVEGYTFVAGLCGEASELAEALQVWDGAERPTDGHLVDHVAKELGDFLWYTAALAGWGGASIDVGLHALQGTVCNVTYRWGDAMVNAGKVAELMKKHLGHDRVLDPDTFKRLLVRCLVDAAVICELVGLSLPGVCGLNIAKLRARFQGGGWNAGLSAQKLDEKPTPA